MPSVDEVYSTSTNGATFAASPNLKKEESDNWEVGFAINAEDLREDGDSFQLKTTYFDNSITNLIDRNPATPAVFGPFGPGVYTDPGFINVDNADIFGVEVEAVYDADLWYANAAYTWTEGKNSDTNQHLDSIAPAEFAFTLAGRSENRNLEYGWKARFVADPAADCRTECFNASTTSLRFADSFDVHDLFVTWNSEEDTEYEGWVLRLGVENIFDTQYKEFLGNDSAKGRTFKFTLAKDLDW